VSVRTVQLDIQNMRSDKLGYNAPIIVVDKRFYTYEDKEYSITNSNISPQDFEKISEVVKVLNQFKGFSFFEDVTEIVTKLEDKINSKRNMQQPHIQFEKNDLLKGLEWLAPLLDAIKQKTALDIEYQSFKANKPTVETVYPYLLKEYRNRWFLLCRNRQKKSVMILALDRMAAMEVNKDEPYLPANDFEVANFFDDVIGVTKSLNQRTQRIILKADKSSMPYILTKPLHASQTILKQTDDELIFSIEVVFNFELEREILGFGESMTVLAPKALRQRMMNRIKRMVGVYGEG
jgi:predicted DNA-binding transcriptional regulator YafY